LGFAPPGAQEHGVSKLKDYHFHEMHLMSFDILHPINTTIVECSNI
jgi:hypothetical protein